jgi:chromosome segregation ATPase
MSIIADWLTGSSPRRKLEEEAEEEALQLRTQKAAADAELSRLRDENSQLRSRVNEARQIIESKANPDTDRYERQIEALKTSHDEAMRQYDDEHKERMKAEKERDIAALELQKAQVEAQHAKNSAAVMEQRAELASKAAEEASETALKVEGIKDAELLAGEKDVNELNVRLNAMKVDQLALKRELAACVSKTGEAHSDLRNLHGYSMESVNGFDKK